MNWHRLSGDLLWRLGYALTGLILAACALLAAVSIAFGMSGRWPGFAAAVLWVVIGVVAFRRLWDQPDRRH